MEKTYFISLISPFTRSINREISGTKKIYICDNGIGKYIGKCEDGNLLENALFNVIKNFGELNYYEKRRGGEIDFILPEKRIAVEVKNKGDKKDYDKLKIIGKDLRLKEFYVITKEFVDRKGFIIAQDV